MSDPNLGKPGGEEIGNGAPSTKGTGAIKKTWASVLGKNLAPTLDNNVLEVVLEKDTRGSFNVTEDEGANLIRRLGLDPRPGVQVVGIQICPNGRGVIYITLKKEVEIDRYCKYDVLDVTSSGIRAVLVKPAGKRDVVVTLKGIHPNTRDETVIEYLGKFGQVVTTRVIHGVYSDGPLKGMRNGDRNYKMELKPGSSIGSYHVLDGQKVSLRFPGQQQTCARCLQSAQHCKGRGMAKRCEAEGGPKVDFTEYILELWKKIGYSPETELTKKTGQLPDEELSKQEGGEFTVGV